MSDPVVTPAVTTPTVAAVVTDPAAVVVAPVVADPAVKPTPAVVDPAAPVAKVVPEKYEFKFADTVVKPDSEFLGEFSGIAKELGLSQEEAQKVADLGPKLTAKFASALATQHETQRTAWETEAKADKEIGGANFDANLAVAKTALKQFDTDGSLSKLLDESGFGNSPAFIKAFYRIGKQISPDTVSSGNPSTPAAPVGVGSLAAMAEGMYPNSPK